MSDHLNRRDIASLNSFIQSGKRIICSEYQISFGGASPVFSDRKRFRYFYRMGTPDQKYTMARIELMKKYNWKKIATIQQAIEFFSEVGSATKYKGLVIFCGMQCFITAAY